METVEARVEIARFEISDRTQSLMCKIGGRVAFIHRNYSGDLPVAGEFWRVMITGSAPSRTYPDDPNKGVYFVKPLARVLDDRMAVVACDYEPLIAQVATTPQQAAECLAALRCGLVEPDVDALAVWFHDKQVAEARRKTCAAQRAAIARRILRQYSFKILKETVCASGDYRFLTHQQYEAFWLPLHEGEWLAVMTSPTTGYALSPDCAGWYAYPGASDPLPPALNQNWDPGETRCLLTQTEGGCHDH